jgi:hypothetical protein
VLASISAAARTPSAGPAGVSAGGSGVLTLAVGVSAGGGPVLPVAIGVPRAGGVPAVAAGVESVATAIVHPSNISHRTKNANVPGQANAPLSTSALTLCANAGATPYLIAAAGAAGPDVTRWD